MHSWRLAQGVLPLGSRLPLGSGPPAFVHCLGRSWGVVTQAALHGLENTLPSEGGSLLRWGSPAGPPWAPEGLSFGTCRSAQGRSCPAAPCFGLTGAAIFQFSTQKPLGCKCKICQSCLCSQPPPVGRVSPSHREARPKSLGGQQDPPWSALLGPHCLQPC